MDDKVTLKSIVEAALRSYLTGAGAPRKPYVFQWTPDSGGLMPGVDLSDWAAVKNRVRDEDLAHQLEKLGMTQRRRKK